MDWAEFFKSIRWVIELGLFTIGKITVTPGTLLVIVLILVATLLISRSAQAGMARVMGNRGISDKETIHTAKRVVHWTLFLCGIVAALQTVGIDLSTLFAAGAVFAVGLGLAMQNIAQNFVSGVILLVERSIRPGDVLEVEGEVVRVKHMGIRSTIAKTRNEEELIIPNSALVQGTVKNFTKEDSLYLLGSQVGVSYGTDLKLVRETLLKAAESVTWREKDKAPRVLLMEFGNSAVEFKVFVWTSDPWNARRLSSDLNEAIWWALKEAKITIAFPQLDVHFDPKAREPFGSAAPITVNSAKIS
jgi:small-conductance mechanosensitive channel